MLRTLMRWRSFVMLFVVMFQLLGPMTMDAAMAQSYSNTIIGAGDGKVFDEISGAMCTAYDNLKTIIYAMAGLAAIAIGVGCMFGKFDWNWMFVIIGGIVIIVLVGEGIQFLVDETNC